MKISLHYPGDSPLWIHATEVNRPLKDQPWIEYKFTLSLQKGESIMEGLIRVAEDILERKKRLLGKD